MNGAESLTRTLVGGGVDVCFSNPGTSEMHFVAALDRVDGIRCVLGLFEGVVTGAADGYARMADKPAATLLHLGPGLGNGLANLHNAKKAFSPVVNVVGDHATYHLKHDAPLTADIEGIAGPVSHWVRTSPSATAVAGDTADAIAAAMAPPGQVATLILPADTAWNEAEGPAAVPAIAGRPTVSDAAIAEAAAALRSGETCVVLMTGAALREAGLDAAGRIATATGARLMSQTSNGRTERGAGRVRVTAVPYPIDQALTVLADVQHIILVGAKAPVAFFAYPDKPSLLSPEGCQIHRLATIGDDLVGALAWLAEEVGAPPGSAAPEVPARPSLPSGELTIESVAATVGALLPEQAIVVDEGITSGRGVPGATRGAPPHDWLQITGGSIGIGLPLAVGAAVACPDRRVVALQADGSAMYTIQGLWTQARENLDITTVLFNNRSYACLHHELTNVGAKNPGRKAMDMLNLDRPVLDYVTLARGMGVEAGRATTADELNSQIAAGLASRGPYLIEAML
ncbi:MAG: acetolactate synthase large subunit [Pseudomonadota bacterium]|nr:acetolactate synthase large subunit [Pseudomonadota bacterium]